MRFFLPLLTRALLVLALVFTGWPMMAHGHSPSDGAKPAAQAASVDPCRAQAEGAPALASPQTCCEDACCTGCPCESCSCLFYSAWCALPRIFPPMVTPASNPAVAGRSDAVHGTVPGLLLRPPIG